MCTGGSIAPGFYDSITVTGICDVPGGLVRVRHDLTIAPFAGLNAITAATVIVQGNLDVGHGGILGLGCSPAAGCSFTTHDIVNGALNASQPASLIIHSAWLGGVSSVGSGVGVNCNLDPIIQSPDYITFEDSYVLGDVDISGYTSCWFGFIRTHVSGSVTLTNNVLADPDAMEIVTNVIVGNLACSGNSPAPHYRDSGGVPNVVFGARLGQRHI